MAASQGWFRKAVRISILAVLFPVTNCANSANAEAREISAVAEKCITGTKYAPALDLLMQAIRLMEEGKHPAAITRLDRGIALVGTAYYRTNVIDDTGMRLVLAQVEGERGAVRLAANLKRTVLSSRLDAFGEGAGCE